MAITITEALAEIKTIGKRLSKKREAIFQYIARQDGIRDPLERDGGSVEFIKRERQAIADLEARVVHLRRGIQKASDQTRVEINGTARTMSEWLTWRRDVAPGQQQFLTDLRGRLHAVREQARKTGVGVVAPGGTPNQLTDYMVNINEHNLAKETEDLEDVLGQLDGQLSLRNATVMLPE